MSFLVLRKLGYFFLGTDDDDDGEHHISFDDDPFLWTLCVAISIGLVCMAGLMSGLTLGLMSMDSVELEVLKRTGTDEEKRYAAVIMPV
jgi:metal transporter CNNM